MSKKDFSKSFATVTIDDVFIKPNKPKPEVIVKTANYTSEETTRKPDAERQTTVQKNEEATSNNITSAKKNVGRPPVIDREKRDKKFTFNTTKTLASIIEEARLNHNQSLKTFGIEVDDSKFIEYLISTHPKINYN